MVDVPCASCLLIGFHSRRSFPHPIKAYQQFLLLVMRRGHRLGRSASSGSDDFPVGASRCDRLPMLIRPALRITHRQTREGGGGGRPVRSESVPAPMRREGRAAFFFSLSTITAVYFHLGAAQPATIRSVLQVFRCCFTRPRPVVVIRIERRVAALSMVSREKLQWGDTR